MRKIICDTCKLEIESGTNGAGIYGGMLRWRQERNWPNDHTKRGARDLNIVHKGKCDDERQDWQWMELDSAVGAFGLTRLVGFMKEPNADRDGIENIIHRLFMTDGKLDPLPASSQVTIGDRYWLGGGNE